MTKTEILFGAPAVGKREGRQTLFNRAYLMGPEGDIRGYYDKMHLVPFGEYVPFKGILFFVNRMVEGIGDYSPGEAPMTLLSGTGASIGTMICFESIFPEISRALVRNGADILANLTNDAWFGDTSAPGILSNQTNRAGFPCPGGSDGPRSIPRAASGSRQAHPKAWSNLANPRVPPQDQSPQKGRRAPGRGSSTALRPAQPQSMSAS